jgi:hypothetical protein
MYELKKYQENILLFLPFLFPFLISLLFFGKFSSCNDFFFGADTAEIPKQIGSLFAYYDFVKHSLFYTLSFFIYSFIRIIFPFFSQEISSQLVLIIYQIFLIYSIFRIIKHLNFKNKILIITLNLILSFSVSIFIVFLPETLSLSLSGIFFLILYLSSINREKSNNRRNILINSLKIGFTGLLSINIMGLTLPYLILPLLKFKKDIKEFKFRFYEIIIAFIISLTPLLLISLTNKKSAISGYISYWSSFDNFLSIKSWFTSFINLFIYGYSSPIEKFQWLYSPKLLFSNFGLLSLIFGLIIFIVSLTSFLQSLKTIKKPKSDSINYMKKHNSEFHIYVFLYGLTQLIFFVFWAPEESIFFSPYIAPLFLINSIFYIDQSFILKNNNFFKFFIILITSVFVSINFFVINNSLNIKLPNNCQNWEIKKVIIPRI